MRTVSKLLSGLIILVFVARVASTYRVFNDTADENFHITTGLEYVEYHVYTIEPQHPPIARAALALFPYSFAGMRLPASYAPGRVSQTWAYYNYLGQVWLERGSEFYWKTLTLARAGNLPFAILLLIIVYAWASRLYGESLGLAAILIVSLDPTVLAHAGLATVDMGATATMLMACYFLWQWSCYPSWRGCLLAAVSTALALASKFSALAFLPLAGGLYFAGARWGKWRGRVLGMRDDIRTPLLRGCTFLILTATLIWAVYLFDVGLIARTSNRFLQAHAVPAPQFWQGLLDVLEHNKKGHNAYLLGQFSQFGWWYYFPVAIAVKSTIPELLLAIYGGVVCWRRRGEAFARSAIFAVLPAASILAVAMAGSIDIGIRHVLLLYPFLALAGAAAFAGRKPGKIAMIPAALLAWHAAESAATHPDYLAYFNEVARGHEEKVLIDSNLDWGQDLARLGVYMRAHNISGVRLRYYAYTYPQLVGVNPVPPGPGQPDAGWVAVSMIDQVGPKPMLKGLPDARVGKSMWLYRVDPQDPVYRNAPILKKSN